MADLSPDGFSDNQSYTLTAPSSPRSPHSVTSSQASTLPSSTGSTLLPTHQNGSPPLSREYTDVPSGWPTLARKIAQTPEFEVFPRFRELNVKSLLYYQVELSELQSQLQILENNDASSQKPRTRMKSYATVAHRMIGSQDNPDPEVRAQYDLVCKIRKLLKEYNDALLQHAQISAMPQPNRDDVETIRVFLKRDIFGTGSILGHGSEIWGKVEDPEHPVGTRKERFLHLLRSIFWPHPNPKDPDLVTTQAGEKLDGFTTWVFQEWIPFYHDCCRPNTSRGITSSRYTRMKTYSGSTVLKFTLFVATIVASVLPTLAIGVLTTAETTMQKLGYIAGFTALFAIGLMCLTDPKTSRVQIFVGTASFTAVLVVFIQNN